MSFSHKIQTVRNYVASNKLKSCMLATCGTFFCLCTRFVLNKMYRKINNLPPGPEGILPFIGFTLNTFINQSWHINVAMTYGPIVYLKTFKGNTVLINDSKIAKQLLSRNDFQDRNLAFAKKPFNRVSSKDNQVSFLQLNGSEWKKGRRFMSSKLIRMLNTKFVNNIFKQSIKNVFEPYLNDIISSKENENNLWYPKEIASYLTFNTVFVANFGQVANIKDNMIKQLMADLSAVVGLKMSLKEAFLYLFPFLNYSSWFMNDLILLRNRLNDNIQILLEKRRKTSQDISADDEEKTYIDCNEELRKANKISAGREIADIILMFIGGTDTTAVTFEYATVLMARQPEIQERVRNELLLNAKNMNTHDKNDILYDINLLLKIPLFRCLIHEILRISCIFKLGGARKIQNDVWINGYKLPSKSIVFCNPDFIQNYSKNENWVNNKKEICLENWLSDENTFYQNESFLLFGYGKRDCVGKQLAMKELRVMIGFLLLNYKLSLQNPNQSIDDVGGRGLGASHFPSEIPVIIQKIT